MNCSLCGKKIIGFDHNAQPFLGRCCDVCNATRVIPERLRLIKRAEKIQADRIDGYDRDDLGEIQDF